MKIYTHQNLVDLISLCIRHINDELSYEETESQVLYVIPSYPVKRLKQEIYRLRKVLEGKGRYGLSYPANWFAAILEVTDNSDSVIQAAIEQQSAYLEKDGKVNKKLEQLLAGLK